MQKQNSAQTAFLPFMSGKLILYYHLTACEESIEFSVAHIYIYIYSEVPV